MSTSVILARVRVAPRAPKAASRRQNTRARAPQAGADTTAVMTSTSARQDPVGCPSAQTSKLRFAASAPQGLAGFTATMKTHVSPRLVRTRASALVA